MQVSRVSVLCVRAYVGVGVCTCMSVRAQGQAMGSAVHTDLEAAMRVHIEQVRCARPPPRPAALAAPHLTSSVCVC